MVTPPESGEVSDWYLTEATALRRVLLVRQHELVLALSGREVRPDIVTNFVKGLA